MKIPEARRPALSGYVQPGQLLPWSWLDARMRAARSYWVTTHARGFPSSRPVWGIWESATLLFSTGGRIARNLGEDARVQVNLESADELVILEGLARPLPESLAATWAAQYNEKYHWDVPVSVVGVFQITPVRALAWIVDPTGLDGGSSFSNSATEWRFEPD